jgi:GTPase Era involved in 16S rRNA processing
MYILPCLSTEPQVPTQGMRRILTGKNGANIKNIGIPARVALEEMLGKRVHLFLTVKSLNK